MAGRKRPGSWRETLDGTRFVVLPHVVLDSPAYRRASHTARSLLVDVALQLNGANNGRLVVCARYMEPRGWKSKDTIWRAVRELVDLGLLVETRKGRRPNVAAWFAVTWTSLQVVDGLDIDPKKFPRGAYSDARIVPSGGLASDPIVPSHGTRRTPASPSDGTMRGLH